MSSTIASGRTSRAALTAAVPDPAVVTCQPSYRIAIDNSSVRLDSSSTASTRIGVPSGRVIGAEASGEDMAPASPTWQRLPCAGSVKFL